MCGTLIAIVIAASIGAFGVLAWWIEIGSARRHWRQAHSRTLNEFRIIHGPDWMPSFKKEKHDG